MQASRSIDEVPYDFKRSSIKFPGHTGRKIDDMNPILSKITRPVAATKSFRFALLYFTKLSRKSLDFFSWDTPQYQFPFPGDSAGGNLAAAVSLRMRDRNVVPPLKAQVLVYPATQALDLRLPSYIRSLNSRGGLTAHHMAKYWLDYAIGNGSHIQRVLDNTHISPDTRKRLKKYVNNDAVVIMSSMDTPHKTLWQQLEPIITNPYFSPGLADDLSRLPRTLILTAGQDPLHDDGEIYAKRLKESGNDVTHRDYPTAHHGIFKHMDIIETRKMRGEIKEFLVQTLWRIHNVFIYLLIEYKILNK